MNNKNIIFQGSNEIIERRDIIAEYQRKQTRLRLKKRDESPVSDQGCHSNVGSGAFQEVVSWGFIWLPGRRHRSHCISWKGTQSPPSLCEPAIEILPCLHRQG